MESNCFIKEGTQHTKFCLFQSKSSRAGASSAFEKLETEITIYRLCKSKQIFIGCYAKPRTLIASRRHATVKLELSVAEEKIVLNNRTTDVQKIRQNEVSPCYQTGTVTVN